VRIKIAHPNMVRLLTEPKNIFISIKEEGEGKHRLSIRLGRRQDDFIFNSVLEADLAMVVSGLSDTLRDDLRRFRRDMGNNKSFTYNFYHCKGEEPPEVITEEIIQKIIHDLSNGRDADTRTYPSTE
jgi:hypothetical protein